MQRAIGLLNPAKAVPMNGAPSLNADISILQCRPILTSLLNVMIA